jgi:hypothetical protein
MRLNSLRLYFTSGIFGLRKQLTWTSPIRVAAILLVSIVVIGCTSRTSSDRELDLIERFPYDDMNHSLVLNLIEGVTNISLTQVVTIQLENRGDLIIAIWPETSIVGMVYEKETEKWVEIKNTVEFPDKGLLVGPRGGEIPSSTAIYFQPDLASSVNSLDVRILVVGHVWDEEQGAGKPVAAYLDLTLEN